MSERLRFALVGSGNMSNTYFAAAEKVDGVDIVAVVSRTGRQPSCLESGRPVEIADSLESLDCQFDAVVVATPNGTHHKIAIEAARLGKHVLTEKPLDVSIEAMDAMTEACDRANVKLGVAYQKRTYPDNLAIKDMLVHKRLGRVFAADVVVKYYRDDAYYESGAYRGTRKLDGGGPFMQQASHDIDIYCWLFGKPTHVVSMLDTFNHEIEVEDHGVAVLRHEDGMIGSITASTIAKPGFSGRLELHAEAGTVVMENDVIRTWAIDGLENPSRSIGQKIHDGAASAAVTETAGHEAILRDFLAAVREDRDPCVTADQARLATELILDIYANAV